MTDLISRLRNAPRFGDVNLNDEAADEIERLRKLKAKSAVQQQAEKQMALPIDGEPT